MTASVVENELEILKTKNLRMEQMLRQAIPLLELCRTHSIFRPESGAYAGRTAALCESLVDTIESELPVQEDCGPRPESFIVSRKLLEELMGLDTGTNMDGITLYSDAHDEARQVIYGAAPVDAERIDACLKVCEGVTTEWLKENPDEANIRLRGEREQRLREEKVIPASQNGDGQVSVDAKALKKVLEALLGADHRIRELQATRLPVELFADNPINVLLAQYNAAVR